MSFVNDLSEVAKEYGLELTSDQISAFNRYYELLVEWNEKINLTAITEPREVAIKHIVDSLSCYQKELFTKANPLTQAVRPGTVATLFMRQTLA